MGFGFPITGQYNHSEGVALEKLYNKYIFNDVRGKKKRKGELIQNIENTVCDDLIAAICKTKFLCVLFKSLQLFRKKCENKTTPWSFIQESTGSCNEHQTVRVKISSSYCTFKINLARYTSKYAMESRH